MSELTVQRESYIKIHKRKGTFHDHTHLDTNVELVSALYLLSKRKF